MTDMPIQVEPSAPAADAPQYHPPVMVEYGSARNLTRTGSFTTIPDGGAIDDGFDPDGGSGLS